MSQNVVRAADKCFIRDEIKEKLSQYNMNLSVSFMYALTICSISENLAGEFIFIIVNQIGTTLTDNAARLHSVLVDLHQVVGQVAQLWLHALWKHSLPSATELKTVLIIWIYYHLDLYQLCETTGRHKLRNTFLMNNQ